MVMVVKAAESRDAAASPAIEGISDGIGRVLGGGEWCCNGERPWFWWWLGGGEAEACFLWWKSFDVEILKSYRKV